MTTKAEAAERLAEALEKMLHTSVGPESCDRDAYYYLRRADLKDARAAIRAYREAK